MYVTIENMINYYDLLQFKLATVIEMEACLKASRFLINQKVNIYVSMKDLICNWGICGRIGSL